MAHAKCDDLKSRRLLLENLADEEGLNGTDHPELWMRFAEGLGMSRDEVNKSEAKSAVQNIIGTFMSHSESSYEEGLASLYAYEYQVPEVAKSKIDGLCEHYEIDDKRSLSFFTVHQEADKYHRLACEKLMDSFPEEKHGVAIEAAKKSAQSLWDFLTDVHNDCVAA